MECFQHQNVNAVGVCKSCHKAVCHDCAIEIPNGLTCSQECADRIGEINEMNERALKIYGIGKHKSKIPATGVIIWFLLASALWVSFLYPYIKKGYFDLGTLAIAVIFTIIFGLSIYNARRTGLKC